MFKRIIFYINIFTFFYTNTAMAQMITVDGKTNTIVNQNGNVYDVRTGTISGNNAFNSFHNFDVYAGSTANLYLPDGVRNLINLIHDKQSNIDGVLNAYKNGKIGGSVYFLNPHGVVIGKTGSVNVGSILLATPDKSFMKSIISENGTISTLATKAILDGDMPINPNGIVSVKGKINALNNVAIKVGSLDNSGLITSNYKVSDIVNTGNSDVDSEIVFQGGKIKIDVANDFVNSGKIEVKGEANQKTGDIVVNAGKDIILIDKSVISSDGFGANSKGGNVILKAENKSNFENGASISAKGGNISGDGGFIELSAKKEVNLNGGSFNASAVLGEIGKVYIDPEILNITANLTTNSNTTYNARVINVSNGVTLNSGTGDLKLEACSISGGSGDCGHKNSSGIYEALLNIGNNVILKGKNVYLIADAQDLSKFNGLDSDIKETVFDFLGSSPISTFAGVTNAKAIAKITLGTNVKIEATEKVDINAKSKTKADMTSVGTLANIAVGTVSNEALVDIGENADIKGKNINISSLSDMEMSVSAMSISLGSQDSRGSKIDGAVAVGTLNSKSNVKMANTTKITATEDVSISALTNKDMKVSAMAGAFADGTIGVGVSISNATVENKAKASGTIVGKNIDVKSAIVDKTENNASSSVGNGTVSGFFINGMSSLLDGISNKLSKSDKKFHEQSNTKLALSGTLAITNQKNTSEAIVDKNASLTAVSNLNVKSSIIDKVENSSVSTIDSKPGKHQKENAVSGAVAIATFDNNSYAYVDEGAKINALNKIDVNSSILLPVKQDYIPIDAYKDASGFWDYVGTTLSSIKDKLNGNLGLQNGFFNTYAQSTVSTNKGEGENAGGGKFGLSGTVNLVDYFNDSYALISKNAKVNQDNKATTGNKVVNVSSSIDAYSLNFSGVMGLTFFGVTDSKTGLGGSYMQSIFNNNAVSVIGDGVVLDANSLNVEALNEVKNISGAGAGGKAETFGFDGSFSWLKSDNVTLAQISGGAEVNISENAFTGTGLTEAEKLKYAKNNISAKDDSMLINVTGGVAKSESVGIGVSGSLTDITRNTEAILGDFNSELISKLTLNDMTAIYNFKNASALRKSFKTIRSTDINSLNDGLIVAISLAGSVSNSDNSESSGENDGSGKFAVGVSGDVSYTTIDGISSAYLNNAEYVNTKASNLGNLKISAKDLSDIYSVAGSAALTKPSGASGTSLGFSGSASINNISNKVYSFVNNSKMDNSGELNLDALNESYILGISASGAGGFAKKGLEVAGSVSINDIDNETKSYISNTKSGEIVKTNKAILKAEDKSKMLSIAGAIAGGGTAAIGASTAISEISNKVQSYVLNASLNVLSNLGIYAKQNARIDTSSIGASGSSKVAVAGSVSINKIANEISSYIDNSVINVNNSLVMKSDSEDEINFYGGAAAGSGTLSGAGTVAVNNYSNSVLSEVRNRSKLNVLGLNSFNYDGTNSYQGLLISSSLKDAINLYGINVGIAGEIGLAANVIVSKIANSVISRIKDSKINENLDNTYSNNQKIKLYANNDNDVSVYNTSIAGGGTGALVGSSSTILVNNTTVSEIVGTKSLNENPNNDLDATIVKSKSDIELETKGKTNINAIVIGGAGAGEVAIAGNVGVVNVKNTNRANIENTAIVNKSSIYSGNLKLSANEITGIGRKEKSDGTDEDFAVAIGAGAIGGSAGLGGSVSVNKIENDVTASIKNSDAVTHSLSVLANSDDDIVSYATTLAVGAYLGGAASVIYNYINTSTKSYISSNYDETKIASLRGRKTNVYSNNADIKTNSNARLAGWSGTAGGGAVGFGASVNINVINGSNYAGIMGSSRFNSSQNINISALSDKVAEGNVTASSAGGLAVSGALNILKIGENLSADDQTKHAGILSSVDSQLQAGGVNDADIGRSELISGVTLNDFKTSLNSEFLNNLNTNGTKAFIGTGSEVSTFDRSNLSIKAEDKVNFNMGTGGVAAGMATSLGASVSYIDIKNDAEAYIVSMAKVHDIGTLSIDAISNVYDGKSFVLSGSASPEVALGGAVSIINSNNNSTAYVGNNAFVDGVNNLNITSNSKADIENLAVGATLGKVALGGSFATTNKSGTSKAFVSKNARIGTSLAINNMNVKALNELDIKSKAYAGSGGIVSGNGAVALTNVNDKLKSEVEEGVKISANGNIEISTKGITKAKANTFGVNAGAVAVGASVSKVKVNVDNQAIINKNADIRANNLSLVANQFQTDVVSDSFAAVGGLVGANAGISNSEVLGNVVSELKDNAKLNVTQNLSITSNANSSLDAVADAYRGGLIAGGAVVAKSNSSLNTKTLIGKMVDIFASKLLLKSEGSDEIKASTKSGSGGVISGSAAISETKNVSNSLITIAGDENTENKFDLKEVEVLAKHTTKQNAFSDSINASVLGGSGAKVKNENNSNSYVTFNGKNNILTNKAKIEALNNYEKSSTDYNVSSGSGGVIDAPAASSNTDITMDTKVTLNSKTVIDRNLSRFNQSELSNLTASNDNDITIIASNDIKANDKVKLVSGGVIPVAKSVSKINANNIDAIVDINGAKITSVDDIVLNANSNAEIKTEAMASTYGVASVAMGDSKSYINTNNKVNIKGGANLLSYGDTKILAGRLIDGGYSKIDVNSNTKLWNNSALPFSDISSLAKMDVNNLIDIVSGSNVKSGKDIFLTSKTGITYAVGTSVAKNPYNEALSIDATSYNSVINNNSSVNINGKVASGVNSIKNIVIDKDGKVYVDGVVDTSGIYHKKTTEAMGTSLFSEIARLTALKKDYINDATSVAYYNKEIEALYTQLRLMGMVDTYVKDGVTYYVPKVVYNVDYVNLYDINAQAGAIEVLTDNLKGSGELSVTSNPKVSITNESDYFLRLNDVKIAERDGGTIRLNGVMVTNNSEITEVNSKDSASFSNVHIEAKNSSKPSINIHAKNPKGKGQSIDLAGDIENYNGSVVIKSDNNGSIYSSGSIHADTVSLTAGGNIVQDYYDGYTHVGGDPSKQWQDVASQNETAYKNTASATNSNNSASKSGNSEIVANNIYIAGRYLNLNGLIQSGRPDLDLTLSGDVLNLELNGWTTANALSKYNQAKLNDPNFSNLIELASNYGNINAKYNILTGKIELDNMSVEGGYLELSGYILNTSKDAAGLKVLDGYGRVNITNNTKFDIVLNDMNIDDKINGVIKITDDAKGGLITIYTKNGNKINTLIKDKYGNVVSQNNSDSAVYSPLDNIRYVWKTGLETIKEDTYNYEGNSFWGMDFIVPDDNYTSHTQRDVTASPLREGEEVIVGASNNPEYMYSKNTSNTTEKVKTSERKWTTTSGWWVFSTKTNHTEVKYEQGTKGTNTHSIRGDYDIKIGFIGNDTASATINSVSNIFLNGVLSNILGETSIKTDGFISALSDGAKIISNKLSLIANRGIGGESGLKLAVNDLNVLNNLSGDINLKSENLIYNKIINNGGDTKLYSSKSILGLNNTSYIKGNKIDLTALSGSIGTNDNVVKIETAGNNGSLKAYASKDINLVQENGNLGIDSIISAGGNVDIDVKNGGVFDANTNEKVDNSTKEALLKTWDDMNLNEISDENELNSLVATYENQKTRDYFDYFEIKSGLNADGIFEFSANQIDTFKSENPDVNIADLVAYKMQRYNELAKEYKDTTYNENYKYVASLSDKNSLKKGAGWSKSQLSYSLNKAKLGEITDTKYMEEQANIVGKKVNLTVKGSVGRDMGSKVIDVSNPSLISEEDKLLLSSAESDNVKFSDDFKTATVYLREDLDIHANELTLSAKDYVYLGAEQDININKIETNLDKNITISGSNGVYNVANDKSAVNIIGNNLVIEAGKGGIGKLDARINLGLKDNAKITLRGIGDTYINSLNNLGVDYIYSKGLVDIKSLSNIFDARNDDKVNIRSNSLNLDVANLGEVSNLFDLVVNELDVKSKNAYLNNAENHDLLIKKGDILNEFALFSKQGNIDIDELKVGSHAFLTSYEGDINLGQIKSEDGSVSLTALKGNVEGKKGIKNIIAKLVDFVNVNGFIGKENNVNIQANRVNAIALNDVNINLLNLDKLSKQSDFGNILSKEGDISLRALNDNFSLKGKIEALKGNVSLKAEKNIIDNVKDTSGTIRANIIDFMAKNGEVGDKDNYINIDSSILGNGYVSALSNKGIFVNEVAGDMMIGSFVSKTGNIDLKVDSSIIGYNFDDNRANLKAKNITLHSNNGTIGNEDNILKLTVMEDGQGLINMESAYGIYALKTSPDLLSNYIKVMKDGDIVFYLPAGKAKIEKLVRKGKADFIFEDGGSDSDVWISALNLENFLTESAISKNIMPTDMNIDIVAPLKQIEEVTNNLDIESHGGKKESKKSKKQKDDELYDLLVMNN